MGVYKYKQSIIVRNDLKMPKGKLAAQVAHASMGALLNYVASIDNSYNYKGEKIFNYRLNVPALVHEWLQGDFAKIVLKCETVVDLFDLMRKAVALKIPWKLITDNG